MKSTGKTPALIMLLICIISWGSVYPAGKVILANMSDYSLALWRFLISCVGLTIYCLLTRQAFPKLTFRQYVVLFVIGLIGITGFNLGLFIGLKSTSATNGALISSLSPLVTSVIAAQLNRKKLTGRQWFSLIVSLCGVATVITDGSLDNLMHLSLNRGDLFIFGAMLSWSLYTVLSQYVSHWLSPIMFTLVTMFAGTIGLIVVCAALNPESPFLAVAHLPAFSLILLLYISIVATVMGYVFWIQGVKTFGPAGASMVYNLVPVFAALVAYMLGQPLTEIQIIGMLIVLAGLLVPALVDYLRVRFLTMRH